MTHFFPRRPSRFAPALISFAVIAGLMAILPLHASAQTETIIYNFMGPPDGSNGYGGRSFNLIQDAAGNFYGVTMAGGVNDAQNGGLGTAFRLSFQNGAWTETVIHSFGGTGDGFSPSGNLVMDSAGNLYGVLEHGSGGPSVGAVFELSPNPDGTWSETILTLPNTGPSAPTGGLTLDAAGNLYGVTLKGGSNSCKRHRCGTIFEVSPPPKNAKKKEWKFAVLYKFQGPSAGDGSAPNGNLVFDSGGNLYGTTEYGVSAGYGTVFELSPTGASWAEKIIYDFPSLTVGFSPGAGVIFDTQGNLYGTTLGGDGLGTVFELSPSGGNWTYSELYSFSEPANGDAPSGPLVFHNGSLYATTGNGGAQQGDVGVVFELSPPASGVTWNETLLHSFSGPPSDGWEPAGGVIFDSHGNLYGIANGGAFGPYGYGVIYEISQ